MRGHIKTQGPFLGAWDSNSRLQFRISAILRHFIIIFCFVSAVMKVLFILLFVHVMHAVVPSPSGVHVPRQHHNEPHSSRSESQFEPFSYKFLARSPSCPAAPAFVFNSGDNRVLQPRWAPNLCTLWTIDNTNISSHFPNQTRERADVTPSAWNSGPSESLSINSRDDLRRMNKKVVSFVFSLHNDCLRV